MVTPSRGGTVSTENQHHRQHGCTAAPETTDKHSAGQCSRLSSPVCCPFPVQHNMTKTVPTEDIEAITAAVLGGLKKDVAAAVAEAVRRARPDGD